MTEAYTPESEIALDGLTELLGVTAKDPAPGLLLELESAEQRSALQNLLQSLSQTSLLPEVRNIDLEHTYDLKLRYGERFDVRLGGTDQLDYKVRYLDEIINRQLDATKTGTIDLTLEESGTARLIPW